MVEFTLPPSDHAVTELVNGAYVIDRITSCAIDGRTIVYGEGSACLDNSCCGQFDLRYLLVYGEQVHGPQASGAWRLRSIDDDATADVIRRELVRLHGVDTVNFYLPA